MQTKPSLIRNNTHPLLSQITNNTTLWIGHLQTDPFDHFAGQTFECPANGRLDNIQVFASVVQEDGEVGLTLHEFDNTGNSWGPAITEASNFVEKGNDDARWLRFSLQPVDLKKNAVYGFRLKTTNAMVGLGEAASFSHQPFAFGHEWTADSGNEKGYYLRYFSLAFKVELCA